MQIQQLEPHFNLSKKRPQSTEGKDENAGNQLFLLFQQCLKSHLTITVESIGSLVKCKTYCMSPNKGVLPNSSSSPL